MEVCYLKCDKVKYEEKPGELRACFQALRARIETQDLDNSAFKLDRLLKKIPDYKPTQRKKRSGGGGGSDGGPLPPRGGDDGGEGGVMAKLSKIGNFFEPAV